jgi:hypothetical protein
MPRAVFYALKMAQAVLLVVPFCCLQASVTQQYLVYLQAKSYGPIASGALFGAGWWFWVDAVVCTSHKIPFDQVNSFRMQASITRPTEINISM